MSITGARNCRSELAAADNFRETGYGGGTKEIPMTRLRTLALALGALALPVAAAAHHGWSWTEDDEKWLRGRIVSINYGNPHASLTLRASKGVWEVDLAPPSAATRAGFVEGVAQPGDIALLTGHRSRDPDELAFKAETITVRGKTYDVYPRRPKTLDPELLTFR
jgi:hypothetical protein